ALTPTATLPYAPLFRSALTGGDGIRVDRRLQGERGLDGGARPLERGDREPAERLHERAAVLLRERGDTLEEPRRDRERLAVAELDRKSTRLNSSHVKIS